MRRQQRRHRSLLPVKHSSKARTKRRKAKGHYIINEHNMYKCKVINCVTCAENFILNLSGHVLSTPEKLLLSKGLSFIPTTKDLNSFKIIADFNKFSQKLRNKVCQIRHCPNQDGFDLYRKNKELNKQIFRPNKFLQFKSTLEQMKVALSTLPCNVRVESNLSRRQRTALHNLCRNRNK